LNTTTFQTYASIIRLHLTKSDRSSIAFLLLSRWAIIFHGLSELICQAVAGEAFKASFTYRFGKWISSAAEGFHRELKHVICRILK